MSALDDLWYGDGVAATAGRRLLTPASWLYGAVVRARNAMYDRGLLGVEHGVLPTLSVGNLSVGGTGKTPLSAWVAQRLSASGARPAVVLRGYGGDELLVHRRLNPAAMVIADADRVRGVLSARARGADCAVLDDAFQHRRAPRDADWVLVSAEQWRERAQTLPAGPLREPSIGLRRASLVVVTRKSATADRAAQVAADIDATRGGAGPGAAVIHLAADALVDAASGERRDVASLADRPIAAVAAVGVPSAFFDQLEAAGARLAPLAYRDHHAYTRADVERIVRLAERSEAVVCTLKDAVKLAPLWPRAATPLWYVSQRAVVERGAAAIDASLAIILAARAPVSPTAGPAGPSAPSHGHRASTAD